MLIKHMRNQEPKITVKQKWPPDDVGSDHQLIPESDPLLSGMAVLPNVSDPPGVKKGLGKAYHVSYGTEGR